MKVLVTGGCGYKGHVLVPKLLLEGWEVVVADTQWFGNFLEPHPCLTVLRIDIRDVQSIPLEDIDAIIHLASIANDPCGDLDPKLTWEISALATMQLADRARRQGVSHFLYASSGSVYGVKDEERVTEDLELDPISEYNKTKMVSERVLLSFSNDMVVQVVRPATVCGFSPRMRLDVAVNLLTMQALTKGEITVLGGKQTRPNIHIDDISDLYIFLLRHPSITGIYNAGFENISILSIAQMISSKIETQIVIKDSNDPRSYKVDSTKLLATGFKPKKCVADAIQDLIVRFKSGGLENELRFYNLEWMQQIGIGKLSGK